MIHKDTNIFKFFLSIGSGFNQFSFWLFNQQLTVKDVYLSYLPLAHIFDRVIEECFIQHGAAIGFWRGVSTAAQSLLCKPVLKNLL